MQPQDPNNAGSSWGAPPPPPPGSSWGAPPPPPPGGTLPPPPPSWGNAAPPAGVTRIAGAWQRVGGALIDSFVVGVAGALLLAPFQVKKISMFTGTGSLRYEYEGFGKYAMASIVVGLAIALLNDVVLVSLKGGSLGKLAVGMRIVKVSDGSPVNSTIAFKRVLLDIVATPAVLLLRASEAGLGAFMIIVLASGVVAIINVVMLFADDRHQTLNDKIAETVIVTNR